MKPAKLCPCGRGIMPAREKCLPCELRANREAARKRARFLVPRGAGKRVK